EDRKKEANTAGHNALYQFAYSILKETLNTPDEITHETISKTTKTIRDQIQSLGGEFSNVDTLLQKLKTVNGKEKEFLIKVNTVL
ncbi:Uncharacterized protein APZ42_004127, partial [Daphnia magna]